MFKEGLYNNEIQRNTKKIQFSWSQGEQTQISEITSGAAAASDHLASTLLKHKSTP